MIGLVSAVHAQICDVYERQFIPAPKQENSGNEFGAAVAIAGDRAIVGVLESDQFGFDAGAAYALERTGDSWTITQTLGFGQATADDRFGLSVALDGEIAVVGAPADLSSAGFAFVYRRVNGTWAFEQQLLPGDPNTEYFGAAVAVSGDVIVVGAPNDDEAGNNAGAAYVFRFNGSLWTQEQKLMATGATANRRIGGTVDLQGDVAVIGHSTSYPGSTSHPVLVFEHDGGTWSEVASLIGPDVAASDRFGASVALDGSTIVVGAPYHPADGAAYVFTLDRGTWTFAQKLIAFDPITSSARFGSAVAVQGDAIIVGAPLKDVQPFPDPNQFPTLKAGGAYVFRLVGGTWMLRFVNVAEPRFIWSAYGDDNEDDRLGATVAISGSTIIVGGPGELYNSGLTFSEVGKAMFFDLVPPDCDGNGVADACDRDCNFNTVNDACEIAGGDSDDCNGNGAPDECEAGFAYALDIGLPSSSWGGADPFDFLWLNQFIVHPGGQRLTHVGVTWQPYGPAGLPGHIVIYDDPNNDGNASDAVLLATAPITLVDDFGGLQVTVYPVPTTYVGEPGESFFVGVFMPLPGDAYVAVGDNTPSPGHQNWMFAARLGAGDMNSLAAGWIEFPAQGDWFVRAVALDCNGNGEWDQCDIEAGTSLDLDNNGVPDECQPSCPADINDSGVVDVDDLIVVILNWGCTNPPGEVGCPADVNESGAVDVDDLIAVILAWGDCP